MIDAVGGPPTAEEMAEARAAGLTHPQMISGFILAKRGFKVTEAAQRRVEVQDIMDSMGKPDEQP